MKLIDKMYDDPEYIFEKRDELLDKYKEGNNIDVSQYLPSWFNTYTNSLKNAIFPDDGDDEEEEKEDNKNNRFDENDYINLINDTMKNIPITDDETDNNIPLPSKNKYGDKRGMHMKEYWKNRKNDKELNDLMKSNNIGYSQATLLLRDKKKKK
jgi:hypothetical protein